MCWTRRYQRGSHSNLKYLSHVPSPRSTNYSYSTVDGRRGTRLAELCLKLQVSRMGAIISVCLRRTIFSLPLNLDSLDLFFIGATFKRHNYRALQLPIRWNLPTGQIFYVLVFEISSFARRGVHSPENELASKYIGRLTMVLRCPKMEPRSSITIVSGRN